MSKDPRQYRARLIDNGRPVMQGKFTAPPDKAYSFAHAEVDPFSGLWVEVTEIRKPRTVEDYQ